MWRDSQTAQRMMFSPKYQVYSLDIEWNVYWAHDVGKVLFHYPVTSSWGCSEDFIFSLKIKFLYAVQWGSWQKNEKEKIGVEQILTEGFFCLAPIFFILEKGANEEKHSLSAQPCLKAGIPATCKDHTGNSSLAKVGAKWAQKRHRCCELGTEHCRRSNGPLGHSLHMK